MDLRGPKHVEVLQKQTRGPRWGSRERNQREGMQQEWRP
jgi:hypothetical protein